VGRDHDEWVAAIVHAIETGTALDLAPAETVDRQQAHNWSTSRQVPGKHSAYTAETAYRLLASTSRRTSESAPAWPPEPGAARPSAGRAKPASNRPPEQTCPAPSRARRSTQPRIRPCWVIKPESATSTQKHVSRRPGVWTPAETLIIDWGVQAGLYVFCAVLAWSRFRFVRFAADERATTTFGLLAEMLDPGLEPLVGGLLRLRTIYWVRMDV
jgi:hypothetical protein